MLDGLGWDQLQERRAVAPTLAAMQGDAILTVAPSTTATAMTSITTGLTPGEHGVIGYRVAVDGEVLNVLRWGVGGRDAKASIPPDKFQPVDAFLGHRPAIVTRADFRTSGFTLAHLDGVRFNGYRVTSTLMAESARLLRAGEPFVYAYYEGIDKVAHEYGLGDHYDAELAYVDRLVGDLISCAAARRRAGGHRPTTARSTSATTSITPAPRRARRGVVPVGRGPVPLAARPARPRRRTCWPRPGHHHDVRRLGPAARSR